MSLIQYSLEWNHLLLWATILLCYFCRPAYCVQHVPQKSFPDHVYPTHFKDLRRHSLALDVQQRKGAQGFLWKTSFTSLQELRVKQKLFKTHSLLQFQPTILDKVLLRVLLRFCGPPKYDRGFWNQWHF
jgi:hypothetical protein